MENDIKKLNEIANGLKRLNKKVLLFKLINKAKEEYDALNFVSGKQSLLEALEIDSQNPVTLRGLGCIEQFEGNFDKAVEFFNKALKHSKQKEIEYTLLGMAYYFKDELDQSVEYFNLAIELNDDYTKAYEGRNQAMLENHIKIIDLQEALKKYF